MGKIPKVFKCIKTDSELESFLSYIIMKTDFIFVLSRTELLMQIF